MSRNLRADYRTIVGDPFPAELAVTFGTQTLRFKKRVWRITDAVGKIAERGLRYGDNPGQPAALYEAVADGSAEVGTFLGWVTTDEWS